MSDEFKPQPPSWSRIVIGAVAVALGVVLMGAMTREDDDDIAQDKKSILARLKEKRL
ncbi:hypothetical protein DPMN_068393 [Dreissena polymorpha]|uniref:Uncharacterized protein n=1 Tax=Dreissena polymorpha TaxID=45954 RepID=A0A9D4BTK7_DREPO|nr:hypothetical protein DPMN_068393 [Dreissena polymorpha]